ncbi:tRNA (N6-threonylcarbamoyladenosine(37)-N6)-methyltransferase TrmO [Chloroflexota bacterium]
MANESSPMTFKPIGIIRNELRQTASATGDRSDVVSEIVIDSSLTRALDGLEEYSHVTVLWWMHLLTLGEVRLKAHPMRKEELPPKGIFALRTPQRPNPIGITAVRLLERKDNILRVTGLDALDGSPVIDVKPYIPRYDSVDDAKVPEWISS